MARSILRVSAILLLLLGLAGCRSTPAVHTPAPGPPSPTRDPGRGEESTPFPAPFAPPAPPSGTSGQSATESRSRNKDEADDSLLVVDRGDGLEPIEIPRQEELDFTAEIDLGVLGELGVGRVTLSSGVEPYHSGLPPSDASSTHEPPRSVGWIRGLARGSYLGYELHHELEVRHLPQPWPSVFYRDTQSGSENRRRELKLGVLDGKETAIFRSDGHCKGCANPEHFVESAWLWGKPYHCKKCKLAEHRVWDDVESRTIPAGSVDLLSAVFLARAMIRRDRPEMTFPVIDKQKLWSLTIRRGTRKKIETPAGRFNCVLVELKTAIPPGEPRDKKGFEGLFGIQGKIGIWMEAASGVPVMISGELPVPVIKTLDLNIRLKTYSGTSPSFLPAR